MINDIISCLIVGYLFGCISTSYIIGKMYNIDIREHGSGNAGTTNTMRVLGKQAGILVYLGDCIKCALAIFIMVIIYSKNDVTFNVQLIKLVTGFGVVLGHNYPFWLKFKGGKGIAVTSAVILIFCLPKFWICPAICLIAFVAIVQSTRYVSLGSLTVVTIFLLYVAVRFIKEPGYEEIYLYLLLFAFLFALSAYFTHRANIVRLLHGTENKLGENKHEDVDESDEYDEKDNYSDHYQEELQHNYSGMNYQENDDSQFLSEYERAQYLKRNFNSDSENEQIYRDDINNYH